MLEKLQTLVAPTSYWQTSKYTRIKNNKGLLLKPICYKVMTIFIIHARLEKTLGGHLDTSKHTYSCIIAIASKALHKSKQNWGGGCYNMAPSIPHDSYFLAPLISSRAVHVTHNICFLRSFEDHSLLNISQDSLKIFLFSLR